MTNNNPKYTDLTQSQRLKEIGFEAEADGWWAYDAVPFSSRRKKEMELFIYNGFPGKKDIKSYRLDTLLLALPDEIEKDGIIYLLTIRPRAIGYQDPDTQEWLYFSKSKLDRISDCVDLICLLKEVDNG